MTVKSAQVWAGLVQTLGTAGGTAAMTGGTAALYVNGTVNAAAVTLGTVNPYSWIVTLPALTAGQSVSMWIAGTIDSTWTAAVVREDVSDTYRTSDIQGYVDDIGVAGAGLTAIPTIATVTNVGTVTGNVNGNITGNIGGSVTGSVASVAGNVLGSVASAGTVTGGIGGNLVGNVLGSVASAGTVTGGIGGNLVGNVQGNVLGSVASATSVGTVTGGVGGNVVGNVQGNLGGSVTGSVASVVAGVTVTTNSDKTGYGLADTTSDAVIADAVWNAATATYGGADSYGEHVEAIGTTASLTAATIADAVWDEVSTGHTTTGKAGEQLWTDVDAILADTDVIGAAGAGLSAIPTVAAVTSVGTVTGGIGGNLVGNVQGAVASVTGEVTVAAASKTGYALSATGLDAIPVTAPTTVATTFPGMVVQLWRRFFKKVTMTSTQIVTYNDAGSGTVTTQTVADDSVTQSQGAAT